MPFNRDEGMLGYIKLANQTVGRIRKRITRRVRFV